jgi:pyruvate/2-oxoglutarate dehydrogenase complex dihydrolipoamide acyltransferase (E2) component
MRPVRIITAFAFAAAVAVTGCTAHSAARHHAAAPAAPVAAAPTAPPVSPAAKAPATDADATTSQPVVLGDGRHPVIIKTVDADRRRITFDVIQFYWGDDAIKEAAKDHQESPPPNDYYIRNANPRLRTLPVRSDATITCNTLTAGYTGSATKDVRVPLDRLAIVLPRGGAGPFWITVRHDQVVKIAEQYVP